MRFECLTCGNESDNKKEFYDVSASTGPRKICKKCASELGYNNFFTIGLQSNTSLLKKYVAIHPEAQNRLDEQLQRIGEYKQEIKSELNQIKNTAVENVKKSVERSGLKKKEQTKCSCKSCGNIYFFAADEELKNIVNILNWNVYTMNKVKDLKQCPKCGSRATEQKKVYFWIDKSGNCVDVEE